MLWRQAAQRRKRAVFRCAIRSTSFNGVDRISAVRGTNACMRVSASQVPCVHLTTFRRAHSVGSASRPNVATSISSIATSFLSSWNATIWRKVPICQACCQVLRFAEAVFLPCLNRFPCSVRASWKSQELVRWWLTVDPEKEVGRPAETNCALAPRGNVELTCCCCCCCCCPSSNKACAINVAGDSSEPINTSANNPHVCARAQRPACLQFAACSEQRSAASARLVCWLNCVSCTNCRRPLSSSEVAPGDSAR
mmetsp:Transcript_101167/g.200956  ORF Transcript_101167/g.200956 Transcript_101167/m.200956 type:complete len:253 (-) Transcript_101167:1564-2322(-)